jgi:hypothetical protein
MIIISLVFSTTVLFRVYSLDISLAENLLLTSNPEISNEDSFVSLIDSSNYETEGEGPLFMNILESDYESSDEISPVDTFESEGPSLDILPSESVIDPSTFGGENNGILLMEGSSYETSSFATEEPDQSPDSSLMAYFGPLIETTNYDSEDHSLIFDSPPLVSSNCDDSSIESEDYLTNEDPTIDTEDLFADENDSTFEIWDTSAALPANLSRRRRSSTPSIANIQEDPPSTTPKQTTTTNHPSTQKQYFPDRITPRSISDLNPNIYEWTLVLDVYDEDGNLLQLKNCPRGKRTTCCWWNVQPMYSQCWKFQYNDYLCAFAKSRVCCRDVEKSGVKKLGGKGIDCEKASWKLREPRRMPPPSPSREGDDTKNEFREVFPILRELPDLGDPAYCKPV